MNTKEWDFKEGKDLGHIRKRKQDFYQGQIDRLPNELRHALNDYNHRNVEGIGYIDENDYSLN